MDQQTPRLIHRSSVNAWECDENGHLNARFFIDKNHQGLIDLFAQDGIVRHATGTDSSHPRVVCQHGRYHREARLAEPVNGYGGFVSVSATGAVVYSELRHGSTDDLYTTFITDFDTTHEPEEFDVVKMQTPLLDIPERGKVRSLHPESHPGLSRSDAFALGYLETSRGVVHRRQCDLNDQLSLFEYSGIVASAIPQLFAQMQSPEEFALRAAGRLGSALVESRVDYYDQLHCEQRYALLSGLRSFTDKTQRLSHLLFNLDDGCLVLHSQAVGVALDLTTRRAVPFSDDRKRRMDQMLIRA